MPTRYDVSDVPMQGGYIAKQCPVRAQNNAVWPRDPLPPSNVTERMFALGRAFETGILARLVVAKPDVVMITGDTRDDRVAETLKAMQQGESVIVGGRLPSDPVGRRVGEPDLLIRAGVSDLPTYRPVDVKNHRTLQSFGSVGARCSELAEPTMEAAVEDMAFSAMKRREDLLQLAHYQRMLEVSGMSAEEHWGGIIGTEGRIVWHDLDAPMWLTPSSSGKKKRRSTLEVYDFEFNFRLDIIAVANLHQLDSSVDLMLEPVRCGECPACPWWGHCGPALHEGAGDVSLLPNIGWRSWNIHRNHGVHNQADLARLDPRTAVLVTNGIDVAALLARANEVDPATPISELAVNQRLAQITQLEDAGVRTAADLLTLSPNTATYAGSGISSLSQQIDLARAALGPETVYRRRGIESIHVPRADVEVDIDLESIEEGVYLWGVLVTNRAATGIETGYRAFVAWEPMVAAVEVRVFERLWSWLTELRSHVESQGRSFRGYCYNSPVESGHLRRLARIAGRADDVSKFLESDEWVDLLQVVRSQLVTGTGFGLKVVAPLAGYRWMVEEPGGAESMVRYDTAVAAEDEGDRERARNWLLEYNKGDVEATLALREWLDIKANVIQGVDSVAPPGH